MLLGEQESEVVRIIPGQILSACICSLDSFQFPVASFKNQEPETRNRKLVLMFFRHVIPVPRRNLDDDFAGLVDHGLAAESGV